jgi:hypothetical protein
MTAPEAFSAGAISRAAADRVVYDVAAVLTIAGIAAAEEALDAVCPASGRTVRQTIEHIAATYLEGAGGTTPPPEPTGAEPEDVLRAGRDALLGVLTRGDAADPAAVAVAAHGVAHALDFLEALPAVCDDAVLVNWALFHDWSGDDAKAKRAQALVAAIEKRQKQRQRRRLARR